jgi:hypothetical protein
LNLRIQSRPRTIPPAGTELADAALRQLIDRYGDDIDAADLPWLGGILGQLRQGYPLSDDQVARVSRIRASLASRCCRGR